MSSSQLSIVMFSALLSHGGGRETWLNNVLPKLVESRRFSSIDVYYIADDITDAHKKISVFENPGVRFIETRLPVGAGKFRSLHRILMFCSNVVGKLRSQPGQQHYVLAIGTFYEGAILALQRLLSRRPGVLVAWIRGVWSKEINHRHSGGMRELICRFEKLFLRCADKVISNGHDTKLFYEQLLQRHVEAIPNALDIAKYATVKRNAFSSPRKVVSYIGRLSEEKGLRAYLEAIACYLSAGPVSGNILFDIVGDGPLRTIAEEFSEKYPEQVRFLGPVANERMLDYLETIDAGVCLTYSKQSGGGGVSNGLLELIGARRLVIAWDSLIFKQVLDDSRALFVEESEISALAGAFSAVDACPQEMEDKVRASSSVLELYSLERHVDHFVKYIGIQ
jgi:glycosyltransferase involved in cell wall biosynthesis